MCQYLLVKNNNIKHKSAFRTIFIVVINNNISIKYANASQHMTNKDIYPNHLTSFGNGRCYPGPLPRNWSHCCHTPLGTPPSSEKSTAPEMQPESDLNQEMYHPQLSESISSDSGTLLAAST